MIPIRSDRKSMPINCRTLNQCYGIPTITVFIFTFTTKNKTQVETKVIKNNTKNLTSDSSLSALKFTLHYHNKEKSKQNHSDSNNLSKDPVFLSTVRAKPALSVFRRFRATFSTAGFFFIYLL